ncbi:MAG: hypothetical protein J1G01_07045 [Clostridiales bacterium]|nr:hypothetical protein [Clostridiales bacterium]
MAGKKLDLAEIEHSDIEILKFILKALYGSERDDLAWRLIERFGSVGDIFRATHEELTGVDGITDRVASFFTVVMPLNRQALLRSAAGISLSSEAELVRFATVYFMNERNPFDACLFLDGKSRVICAERLIEEDRILEVISGVCRYGAVKLAWLRLEPHKEDRSNARLLAKLDVFKKILPTLALTDTEFVDYIEYVPFEFFSLRRAFDGDENLHEMSHVKSEDYKPRTNMLSELENYSKLLVARLADDGSGD